MDFQLRSQLAQRIRISTSLGAADAYGQKAVTGTTLHWARVEEQERLYDRADGQKVRTTHMIILDTDVATPTFQSMIWLPGQSSSTLATDARQAKIVKPCVGEDGSLDHWEIRV